MRALALGAALMLVAQPAQGLPALPVDSGRTPNELGHIPILVYHTLGETDGRWQRSRATFRADLEMLYARG
jgi:hypothetical protein